MLLVWEKRLTLHQLLHMSTAIGTDLNHIDTRYQIAQVERDAATTVYMCAVDLLAPGIDEPYYCAIQVGGGRNRQPIIKGIGGEREELIIGAVRNDR